MEIAFHKTQSTCWRDSKLKSCCSSPDYLFVERTEQKKTDETKWEPLYTDRSGIVSARAHEL